MCSSSDGVVGCPILAGDELMTQQLSREVGLRRRDAFSEPLGRRSSKFEKASACVSEHSGKLWSSPFHRMPCICACRTCPFRNIARTKRHVAPSRTWDMSCLPSPRCSLPPLLAFRNLYYRSGNPKHVSKLTQQLVALATLRYHPTGDCTLISAPKPRTKH